MKKEFFKSQIQRMREALEADGKTRLFTMPSFMLGGNPDNFGIQRAMLDKLFNMCEIHKVTEDELAGAADLAIARRMKGIGKSFFPTDDELRRIVEDWRELHGLKRDTGQPATMDTTPKQNNRGQALGQRKSHLLQILCADCLSAGIKTQHRACDMCPVCWPGYSKAVAA